MFIDKIWFDYNFGMLRLPKKSFNQSRSVMYFNYFDFTRCLTLAKQGKFSQNWYFILLYQSAFHAANFIQRVIGWCDLVEM